MFVSWCGLCPQRGAGFVNRGAHPQPACFDGCVTLHWTNKAEATTHQEKQGADGHPADPPEPSRAEAEHFLHVTAELTDPWNHPKESVTERMWTSVPRLGGGINGSGGSRLSLKACSGTPQEGLKG